MKVQDLETFVVGNPPPAFGGRYFFLLRLRTACGIVGYGEVYAASVGPLAMQAVVEDVFARHLQGHDPSAIERFFRSAHASGYSMRPDPTLMGAVSGLEMACWDIVGKALERPAHALLGGRVRDRVRTYTYLYPRDGEDAAAFYASAEASAERAAEYAAQGFTAVKFDPAGPYSVYDGRQPDLRSLERSERFCRLVRDAVGPRVDLLFGTHGQFTPAGAIRLARKIAAYDPLWFEEPTPPEMPEAMAQVARASTVPIATGERLCTKWEFARVLALNAAAILQPNLGRVGGLLEAKKVATLAEAHYAQIAPHVYCGPIVAAASVQLAACTPNFLILEGIERWGGFQAELLRQPLVWERGSVAVPDAPGLGVELDEDVARRHPYTGDALHLEMTPEPCDGLPRRRTPGAEDDRR